MAALDSLGVPIVGGVDFLLVYLSTTNPKQAYGAALCAIAGSLAGSCVLFLIARKGGEVMLEKHTSHGNGLKLRNWFERYGLLTVFIPAISPLPMPMKIPVFCAGALEVRFRSFVAVVTLARVIRYLALAYLGQRYGAYTFTYLRTHWLAVIIVILFLCALAVTLLRFVNRKQPEIPEEWSATRSEQS